MKKLHTLLCAGALAAAAFSPAFAQTQGAASSDDSHGTLGKRYAGLDFSITDLSGTSKNAYGASLNVNVPVTHYLDVSVGVGHGWFKSDSSPYLSYKSYSTSAGADLVFYKTLSNGVKPLVSVGASHSWSTLKVNSYEPWYGGGTERDESNSWGAAIGVEIPFSKFALTPMIGYADDFEGGDNGLVSAGLEVHSWITRRVGVYADVAYSRPTDSDFKYHNWSYGVGMRFKF